MKKVIANTIVVIIIIALIIIWSQVISLSITFLFNIDFNFIKGLGVAGLIVCLRAVMEFFKFSK